jgi:hypothetical protein
MHAYMHKFIHHIYGSNHHILKQNKDIIFHKLGSSFCDKMLIPIYISIQRSPITSLVGDSYKMSIQKMKSESPTPKNLSKTYQKESNDQRE